MANIKYPPRIPRSAQTDRFADEFITNLLEVLNLHKSISKRTIVSMIFKMVEAYTTNSAVLVSDEENGLIHGETDGLVTLRDSESIINALIDFMIEDSITALEITKMYIQAFESDDLKATVESYLYYKEKYIIREGEIWKE